MHDKGQQGVGFRVEKSRANLPRKETGEEKSTDFQHQLLLMMHSHDYRLQTAQTYCCTHVCLVFTWCGVGGRSVHAHTPARVRTDRDFSHPTFFFSSRTLSSRVNIYIRRCSPSAPEAASSSAVLLEACGPFVLRGSYWYLASQSWFVLLLSERLIACLDVYKQGLTTLQAESQNRVLWKFLKRRKRIINNVNNRCWRSVQNKKKEKLNRNSLSFTPILTPKRSMTEIMLALVSWKAFEMPALSFTKKRKKN